jgi:hypothetical protein
MPAATISKCYMTIPISSHIRFPVREKLLVEKHLPLPKCAFVQHILALLFPDFHIADIHQFVHDGIDGEAGRRMDVELAGDVAAVGGHGVDGNE